MHWGLIHSLVFRSFLFPLSDCQTYLNVLHTSSNYMSRILDELSSERNLSQYYPQEKLADVQAMVQGLDVLVGRMRSAVSVSVSNSQIDD